MTRTAMTIDVRPSSTNPTPTDLAALRTFDNGNGMTCPANGSVEVILQNSTGGTLTYTVTSQPNTQTGRTKTLGPTNILAGHFVLLPEFKADGWATAGVVNLDASGAIHYAAIQRAPGA